MDQTSTPDDVPKVGRPAVFDRDIAEAILLRLADGESLRSICCDQEMPARTTVYSWIMEDTDGFADHYARARELQADSHADDIIDIADDGSNDWMERRREGGSVDQVVDHEHIQRSKLRVDARKWAASKLKPKRYGERIDHTSSDGSMSPPTLNDFYADLRQKQAKD